MHNESKPRYEGPRELAQSLTAFAHVSAPGATWNREGLRADSEYRDLGLAAATNGRIGVKHIRAIKPFAQPTGWHWHDMTAHYVYVLRGSLTFRFAGVEGDVTLHAGDGLSQPAGVPHNVIARSDDMEVIEINEPAVYGTWDLSEPPPSVAMTHPFLTWLRTRGGALAIFALLFMAWEVAVHVFAIKEYLLPPPSKVWTEFWKRHEIVAGGAWVTTQEILAGYALAVVVSIPLALAVAYSRFMEQAVYPVIVFLQIVPKIAIAPLFIIWFGFGFMPKLLLVFLLSFFPIVVSSIAGFKSADRDVMDFARTTGASAMKMFWKIRLPQALPHIFTGLKVGAALAATAAVVAEFVASDRGLGYLLLQYNGQLDTPMVFATIVILSLIGLVVYYVVEIAERLAIPWHVSQQATAKDATL